MYHINVNWILISCKSEDILSRWWGIILTISFNYKKIIFFHKPKWFCFKVTSVLKFLPVS